jgi:hypothetical protein
MVSVLKPLRKPEFR